MTRKDWINLAGLAVFVLLPTIAQTVGQPFLVNLFTRFLIPIFLLLSRHTKCHPVAVSIGAGIVLFAFGTGPIKGFAVTLIMGIIASMITAIFVTKTFFLVWLDRKPHATTLSI